MGNFGFDTRRAAERVAEATRFVERKTRGGGPDARRWPVITEGMILTKAKAPAGGIPAKSGNTAGSATCTFYTWDGTNEVLGSQTDTVKNTYTSAVGANKDIWVVLRPRTDGGTDWTVLTEAC